MIDEYVLVPDIFDRGAYSNPAFIEMCLPPLKELLLREAIVRDLYDGEWSNFCLRNSGNLHRLCKEIFKKLLKENRLRKFPSQISTEPVTPKEWCFEGLRSHAATPLTGIIAAHATKQGFDQAEVASIEKLTGTNWWQKRSTSVTVNRKTSDYLAVLGRVFQQANSFMFIDPNINPDSNNYREFGQMLVQLKERKPQPQIEIHRSVRLGDGKNATVPDESKWREYFEELNIELKSAGLSAEVFFWDDFHDRYLITDILGVIVPAGFDVTRKQDDPSTWGRMGREDRDKIQKIFDPAVRKSIVRFTIGTGNTSQGI